MIHVDPGTAGLIMLGAFLIGLISGLPVAFALGIAAVICTLLFWGAPGLYSLVYQTFDVMNSFVLVAIPLFIFMAMIVDKAGIAGDMFNAAYEWAGPARGGLAIGVVIICTILAACTGIVGGAVSAMGIIALPRMLERGYDRNIATGSILAGGTLGQLIPPSVAMILYASQSAVSVGALFAAGVCAGVILSALFITYIGVRSFFQTDLCPALPIEERVTWREKITSFRHLILPLVLIVLVLGSIFLGIATPTEAAGVGAVGALFCAIVRHRLNWKILHDSIIATVGICTMIGWIILGAACFSMTFIVAGGKELVWNLFSIMPGGSWTILALMLFILLILGMLIDAPAIIMVTVPLFSPVVGQTGIDVLWFALLFMVMLQIGWISPPFGESLFYLKGVTPSSITLTDLYKASIPFVGLQLIGLAIFVIWPESTLWLPHILFK